MSDERDRRRGLGDEELDRQRGEELPDREAMSLIDSSVAIPPDAAIAADVLAEELASETEDEPAEKTEEAGGQTASNDQSN
jgi:hypothetical protein